MEYPPYSLKDKRIWVAGHRGMVGSALLRRLASEDCETLCVDRASLDLRRQDAVFAWMESQRPDAVIVAAARVGGIVANRESPAEFLYDNLMIAANIAEGARRSGVGKLLYIASTAVYPHKAEQPLAESALLQGEPDPHHEGYAIAKIAGIKLVQTYRRQYGLDFIAGLPTNLYGPDDQFDPQTSHVLPALIRKAYEARQAGDATMTIWGTGTPRREFLHADDCADACIHLLQHYSGETVVNIGFGSDVTILEAAQTAARAAGYEGRIVTDPSKPDGMPRRLVDSRRLRAMGWAPKISLEEGLVQTCAWFEKSKWTSVQ